MINKKILLVLLFSTITLLLFPGLVSAGCCVDTGVDIGCEVDTNGQCTLGTYTPFICPTSCPQGCCCPPGSNSGIGSTNYSCSPPKIFTPDPSVSTGLDCICGGVLYSISGRITITTGAISGATVSAGGKSNTSGSDGTYNLTGVPEGTDVVVNAFKGGCLPGSTTIPNLDSDKQNINIQLDCEACTIGSCDAVNDAYCKSNRRWQTYDLSDPTQKDTYCSLCIAYDPDDCGVIDVCIDDDGVCPVSCDASTDSDCVCSMIPNGICPMGCNKDNDVDCNIYSAVCGDNITTYPYETCEETPALGQLSYCNAEDCVNCNCVGLSGCGNYELEPGEECEIGTTCTDGSPCENCECGTPQCTGTFMNPDVIASFDVANKEILVNWSLLDSCIPSVFRYIVFRCHKGPGNDCSLKTRGFRFQSITSSSQYSDTIIDQNSEYCYYVRAYYFGGGRAESGIMCVETGSYFCMEPHPDEFCWDNVRSKCAENYNIESIEDCSLANDFCMGPDQHGNTICTTQGVCDLCNGLYGMFSNLDLTVKVDEGGYLRDRYCHFQPGRFVVEGCYLDRTKTLFSAFDYCAYITSCYDYKSYDACTDSGDPCGKNQGCVWADKTNTPEFNGVGGVCRPADSELQQCELCDENEYNWLSPDCTLPVCKLFGEECYYQGKLRDKPSCTKQSTLSCLDCNTQQECIGGTPVYVDASYDSEGNRTGGTHQLTPSSDRFDLGKCYWHAGNGWCLRNADNYPEDNIGTYGFDCDTGDHYCESDFSNPETTILPSGFAVYPADVKISFSVSDNKYFGEEIKTYFCIAPLSSSCYPTELAVNGVYEKTISTTGDYTVYYYSEDYAKNLEVVKNISIKVDAEPPVIIVVSPSTEEAFPTAQDFVDVNGFASTDTKYMCTYNFDFPSEKNCNNNCAVPGAHSPCINSTTGEFNIMVSVTENGPHDILFDAEDFAGNKVVGLSLLSIYRNDTEPQEPIVIIEGLP
nr:carboxypeptidase regulatory-like domain-containing protein [Nanoarchaeota archaeon]